MASVCLLLIGLRFCLLARAQFIPILSSTTTPSSNATNGSLASSTTPQSGISTSSKFLPLPTPKNGSIDPTAAATNKTIAYTFSNLNSIGTTTPPITLMDGNCGFCSDDNSRCFCYDGCYFDPRIYQCQDRDECLFLPCINGGTCQNVIGYYFCLCREGYAGRDCEIKSDNPEHPVVFGISRNRGILAGGGQLEISGRNFDLFPPVIVRFILKSNPSVSMQGSIKRDGRSSSNSERFVIITPKATKDLIGTPFELEVVFARFIPVSVLQNFTYTDNPTLSGISPINPLVTLQGGARLTIAGTNLDVPSMTEILAELEVFNLTTTLFTGLGRGPCHAENATVAYCEMPNYGMPKNNSWMAHPDNFNGTIKANLTHDAFTDRVPRVVSSFRQPRIIATSDLEYYEPERNESLKFVAENVDSESTSKEDYLVHIGGDIYNMTAISTNRLECMPPPTPPRLLKNSISICNADGMAVFIEVHGDPQFAKCVAYYNNRRPLIIGLSVAAAIIIVAAAILLFVFRKRLESLAVRRMGNLSSPRKAYGTLSSGVTNPRVATLYENKIEGVELYRATSTNTVLSDDQEETNIDTYGTAEVPASARPSYLTPE